MRITDHSFADIVGAAQQSLSGGSPPRKLTMPPEAVGGLIFEALEFVREKWNRVFPKGQTKIREAGACLVQSEPDKL
jgi:hypothetical protein